ncbi:MULTISPECIES: hypothetical protein [unclassified Tenacibaculum]|uniref:hypothetical protein n=1 Tax=unclassified Tenacibaculum TaxID=2635139 RepID=UPI001F4655AC|nr:MULTISPECIES: hypothetical protein [unclassified Tenacibaculum]MCF2874631.1 hypothetical protein [Tenacibaculum sp. Cn5-1]MCF2934303.1 hypothetical protein [Tenacibaculum sp. Cn5-34]MCG7510513.1 hypothetical protein [Tenacibaculum sp. Cn5-46]
MLKSLINDITDNKNIASNIASVINIHYQNVKINAIIIVGSNHQIKNLKNINNKNSDVDIIILSEKTSNLKQFNYDYEGINLDIILTNPNNILSLILEAFNGSKQAGKIFSSSILYSIVYDENGIGKDFMYTVQKVYSLLKESYLPNYYTNSLFLHNINSNLNDIYKQDLVANFFSLHRTSTQIFDYISTLIYPFKTSGSYRGKVFNQNFPNEFNNELTPYKNSNNYFDFIESSVSKFAPVSKTKFQAFLYSDELKKELTFNKSVSSFFFGYDNLLFEKEIIFLTKEDISKLQTKLTPIKLTNIIPLLVESELNSFYQFLNYLSTKYIFSSLNDRKEVMEKILYQFTESVDKTTIENSLKTITLIKVIVDIIKESKTIPIKEFRSWLESFNLKLKQEDMQSLENHQLLPEIFSIINNSSSIKEKEIKTNFIFFSILKSLRIKVEDIDFS